MRQAWENGDAAKAERLLRNLARCLESKAPGMSKSILEGLDEILTVTRLGLPLEMRRSLAPTSTIEPINAFVGRAVHWKARSPAALRQVCRNVKRWTAAGMIDAALRFRRLKACKQLPIVKAALEKHRPPEAGAAG